MQSAEQHIIKIENILKKRGEEWPLRGKYWHLFNEEAEKFYNYLTNNLNYNLISDFLQAYYKIENKPIFICGNLKSGTTLLSQLIDNHKNIFSLPGDTFFIKKFYNTKEDINKIGLYWLKRLLNPTGQAPFLPYGTSVKIYQNFINYLHFLILKEKKDTFMSVVISFAAATKKNEKKEIIFWAEKTPLNELYAKKLYGIFPKAKFLNIVRDPVQNIISLKKLDFYRNKKSNMLQKALFQIFLINQTKKNQKDIQNYKIISYETLTSETEKTMKEVASFLNIDFSTSLLVPTINGIPASANSMYTEKRQQGQVIKTVNNSKKLKELNKCEKTVTVNILSVHKPYKDLIKKEYPELIKFYNRLFCFAAKIGFVLYKIYRKTVK